MGTFNTGFGVGLGPTGTLHYFLLPYIEQDNIYNNSSNSSQTVGAQNIKLYLCPSDVSSSSTLQRYGYASTNYAGNLLVFKPTSQTLLATAMPDGSSNTVMFAERYRVCAPSWGGYTSPGWAIHPEFVNHGWDTPTFGWHEAGGSWDPSFTNNFTTSFQIAPQISACDWRITQGPHIGGMNVGLGDGSVRGVGQGMSVLTWYYACVPNDGQIMGPDW